MPAPRHQTLKYLRQRFQEVGIHPDTRHGQNFLIDINLQRLIVDSANLDERDVVLEVGTGTGALSAMMAQQAGRVVTVEIDPELYQLASEELIDAENVVMLRQDALKNKNRFHPNVLVAIEEALAAVDGPRLKLVANLPYNVATPVLSNLLSVDPVPALMTATIQKELADRIVARPSTKDYGALSVWMQAQCEVELLRTLPPTVFWPRPKVTSAIVRIRPDAVMRANIPDLDFFHDFVRKMFFHRRKYMRSVMVAGFKGQLEKSEIDELMAQFALGPESRTEQLDVATMLALCEAVRQRIAARA